MDYVAVRFAGADGPLDGRYITARGYHGLLFHVLKQADRKRATWLHKHSSPKPFSMVPYYSADGHLAGARYALLTDQATEVMLTAWQHAARQRLDLRLGPQELVVEHVEYVPGPDFHALANQRPAEEMRLEFVSPTTFRQGPGSLPLPLPGNVFDWPLRVWQTYAPEGTALRLPHDWLKWCDRYVFVTDHDIQTARVTISVSRNGRDEEFTGFVGPVTFTADRGTDEELRIWQGLGRLAAFSGVGHKTTMGMGAIGFLDDTSPPE